METLWRYTPLLIVAGVWELLPRTGLVSPLALPPFSSILVAWWELAASGELWQPTIASLYRGFGGLGLAIGIGVPLGILMATVRWIDLVFGPIVKLFYPMPKSALIPVMLLWLGLGDASKIVLIFLGCMLPVIMSAYNGARSADKFLIWTALSMGASHGQVIREVVFPSAVPDILAGIRTALALSFLLLVSSELTIARDGLGYMIGWLGDSGAYPFMFAVILTVSLIGFTADRLYLMMSERVLEWR